MSKKDIGLTFILAGITFLMASFPTSTSTILWGVFLGVSVILNLAGTTIIFKYLNIPNAEKD